MATDATGLSGRILDELHTISEGLQAFQRTRDRLATRDDLAAVQKDVRAIGGDVSSIKLSMATRQELPTKVEKLDERVRAIESWKDNLTGRIAVWTAIVAVITSVAVYWIKAIVVP